MLNEKAGDMEEGNYYIPIFLTKTGDMERRTIKISLCEDNAYYNTLLSRKISCYIAQLEEIENIDFDLECYTTRKECLKNIDLDVHLLITDYYLEQGSTAQELIHKVRRLCDHCTIIILSTAKHSHVIDDLLKEGVESFIHKDEQTLLSIYQTIDRLLKNEVKK